MEGYGVRLCLVLNNGYGELQGHTLPMNDIINDIIGRIMSGKESSLAGNVSKVSHMFFHLL